MEICVIMRGKTSINFSATIDVVPDGSAEAGTDFQFSPEVLSYNANSSQRSCFDLVLSEDGVIEREEFIMLYLTSSFSRAIVNIPTTEVIIADSTTSQIDFLNDTEITITEGNSASLCFGVAVQLERDINVRIEFSNLASGMST